MNYENGRLSAMLKTTLGANTPATQLEPSDRIAEAIRAKKYNLAISLTQRLSDKRFGFEKALVAIGNLFFEAGQGNRLLDCLFSAKPVFESLSVAGLVGLLAKRAGRLPDYKHHLQEAIKNGTRARFRTVEYVRKLTSSEAGEHYDAHLRRLLFSLKYAGIENPRSPSMLFSNGYKVAPQVQLARRSVDSLFAYTSTSLSRSEWDLEVQAAYAIQHLTVDALGPNDLFDLIDPVAIKNALEQIDLSRRTLILLHHAGFTPVRQKFMLTSMPNSLHMANTNANEKYITVHTDRRAALFAGLRALMEDKVVSIAPDGQQGVLNFSINVLGNTVRVGDGAVFLAYESKCETVWLTMNRGRDSFVPVIVRGPKLEKGEAFPEFRARLLGFYERMLNEFFSGDPKNLLLKPRWPGVFAAARGSHKQ